MPRPPIRIAVLQFVHETVTFLRSDTTIDDYTYPGSPAAGEALLASEPRSYIGGFVKGARECDGVELVGIESPLWSKRGTGCRPSRSWRRCDSTRWRIRMWIWRSTIHSGRRVSPSAAAKVIGNRSWLYHIGRRPMLRCRSRLTVRRAAGIKAGRGARWS